MTARVSLALVGPGNVGSRLLGRLTRWEPEGVDLRLTGLARRGSMRLDRAGFLDEGASALDDGTEELNLRKLVEFLDDTSGTRILVDTSSSTDLSPVYAEALDRGIHVVTACKGSLVTDFPTFSQLQTSARKTGSRLLYRACVGAGLGLAQMVREHSLCGDPPVAMGGVLGGTPSFLMNEFMERDTLFSQLVIEAMSLGYTDPPDPRLDLSGEDAANKAALLMWVMGIPITRSEISVDPLLSLLGGERSLEKVLADIRGWDPAMEERKRKALEAGRKLRYVFRTDELKPRLTLEAVSPQDPAFGLRGAQNLLWVMTETHNTPRSQIGFGAGPEWTALGVQMDIAKAIGLL